jgi:hypothetical protein
VRCAHPREIGSLNSFEHLTRARASIAAGGILGLAFVCGSATAHADSGQEKQACQLMDDPAGAESGYSSVEYAYMQLRATMSAEHARNVISLAVQDYCPNHLTDLPAGWR